MFEKLTRTDVGLLRAYANGDLLAFERLYQRHKGAIYNFLYRSLGNFAAAEDIAQDVWLVVVNKADSFDRREASFKTWLFTVARNKLIDHQRRKVNQPHVDIDEHEAAARGLSAEDTVLMNQLLSALEQLPQEQREAFMLQQEGFSNREICKISGVGAETVKSRLRYAKSSLKHRVGAHEL